MGLLQMNPGVLTSINSGEELGRKLCLCTRLLRTFSNFVYNDFGSLTRRVSAGKQ